MERQQNIDRYLALLPAVVLFVVAGAHLWRSQSEPITSWRGGGFGMYADINDEKGRYIRAYVLRNDWQSAKIGSRLGGRAARVRVNPSSANVTALAEYFACSELFLSQNAGARQIRLEYWEQKFEAATYTVRLEKRLEVSREPCHLD
jgi:hypothetical protein